MADGFVVPVTTPATVTVLFASGFPNWSSIVTLMLAAVTPSAGTVGGDAVITDLEGDGVRHLEAHLGRCGQSEVVV